MFRYFGTSLKEKARGLINTLDKRCPGILLLEFCYAIGYMLQDKEIRHLSEWMSKVRILLTIKHVFGPRKIKFGRDEAVVICVVRNGEPYIRTFIGHYVSMGVRHIVFLDNDSKDDTVKIAKIHKNVTVLSTKILMREYEIYFENYLMKKYCSNGWCINVDIDELIDYPFSRSIGLRRFLQYLNMNSYTAVVGQMLDMFSDQPLREMMCADYSAITQIYRYYDISHITKYDYMTCSEKGINNSSNRISNAEIKFYFDGIRHHIFNSHNGLTKHPIIFIDGKLELIHPHCVKNAYCADISIAIYHYPFLGLFERAKDYCRNGYSAVGEYKAYISIFQRDPGAVMKQGTSRALSSVDDLIENGFLVVSDSYLDYVRGVGQEER